MLIAALFFLLSIPTDAQPTSLVAMPTITLSLKTRNPVVCAASFSLLTLSLLQSRINETIAYFELPALPKKATPRQTVFAFDLHHVLFAPDMKEQLRILYAMPHKSTVLLHLINPCFLIDLARCVYKHCTLKEIERLILQKYPALGPVMSTVYTLANALVPVPGTFEIIQALKRQNFKVYLLSNIDEYTFEHLRTQIPEYFKTFDGLFFRTEENGNSRKPHRLMYEQFLDEFHLDKKQVIFVDDLLRNIHGASQVNIHGIYFRNAHQFTEKLKDLGIIISEGQSSDRLTP
jgi:HAD superfamily hydrolase (TIGR01509 family)